MNTPKIVAKRPLVLEFEPGTDHWCACGLSKSHSFCDGSHEGSGFEPVELVVETTKQVFLCQCKHTASPPFCDGTHKAL